MYIMCIYYTQMYLIYPILCRYPTFIDIFIKNLNNPKVWCSFCPPVIFVIRTKFVIALHYVAEAREENSISESQVFYTNDCYGVKQEC